MTDMQVKLGQTILRNPVVLAAGTCGVMGEIGDAINLSNIGAITTKSITKEPQIGNTPDRIHPLQNGMINAIGLANEGIDSFVENQVTKISSIDTTVIASVAGDSISSYVEVARRMDDIDGINLVEINVSCPNTDDGMEFGLCTKKLSELLTEVRQSLTRSSMIVKLSAVAGDIRPHAEVAINCGADALTLINTIPALSIDIETRKPNISRGIGGLSGAIVHPVAVRTVQNVYSDVAMNSNTPIIGTGGVMNWKDAAEFILAGATAVGIGTASFINPSISIKVVKGLTTWVRNQGCDCLTELVGAISLK
ncbi:MAG: dihydroorotate dehydrogenase [Phycisphaerales bacterium]|jgi:dihydroorotate dehydrogenase (NAD+) catalytic subunit|nr:dihydroorotate dehydrogenase [Phycisphaerales bacterium]